MINTKPHHLVDIITQYGAGTPFEPHPYGHAVHTVAKAVLDNIDVEIKIELGADDICAPCIHNINGLCDDTIDNSDRPLAPKSKREWNLLIDKRWSRYLGIKQGDALTVREFCDHIERSLDEMPDIYREETPEKTARRRSNLEKGLARIKQKEK